VGDLGACRRLLLDGIDVNGKDAHSRTALYMAASKGHLECVELFLDHEADAEIADNEHSSPLHKAVVGGHVSVQRALLHAKADVECKDKKGSRPIHLAAFTGDCVSARLLISHSADLECADDTGLTPLHWAIYKNHLRFAELLVEENVKVDACDASGRTPLFYAAYANRVEGLKFLLENGADHRVVDHEDRTALEHAKKRGLAQATAFLEAVQNGIWRPDGEASKENSAPRAACGEDPAQMKELKRNNRALERRLKRTTQQQEKTVGEKEAIERRLKRAQTELDLWEERLAAANERTAEEAELKSSALAQVETLRERLLQSERRCAEQQENLESTAGKLAALRAELTAVQAASAEQATDNCTLRTEIGNLQDLLEQQEKLLHESAEQSRELQKQLSDAQSLAYRQELEKKDQLRKNELLTRRIQNKWGPEHCAQQVDQLCDALADLRTELGSVRAEHLQMAANTRQCFAQLAEQMTRAWNNTMTRYHTESERMRDLYTTTLRERKDLFNQLQDLKGNIRVFCRVRPVLGGEEEEAIGYPELQPDTLFAGPVVGKHKPKSFEFDKVFRPDSTQEEVFADTKPLVTSVIDGYNVCILAYGQTGSGKTFTMEGPPDQPGVNTRALQELFAVTTHRGSAEGYNYQIEVSIMEIYNDKVYDLLVDFPKKRGFTRLDRPSLDIKSGDDGMYVPGLTTVPVECLEDVHNVLSRGHKNRATGATDLNEHSSRSHLLLRIEVHGRNEKSGDTSYGKLHLVDLAGSERVSRSGATDERLREAQHINLSLSALGNVIECLANRGEGKRRHIPYRDSSLTYLLQDSLGAGDSKTLMFVQVSNNCTDLSETVCSLNFASRVRGADLGTGPAKRHASSSSSSSSAPVTRSRRQNA